MINLNITQINGLTYSFDSEVYDTLRLFFYNSINGRVVHRVINKGTVDKIDIHYLVPWHIEAYDLQGNLVLSTSISYEGSTVGIIFGSTALGDTLAWVPQVERWIHKNNPEKVYLHTAWNHIFDKHKYSNKIIWVDNKEELAQYSYSTYFCLGVSKYNQTPTTAYYDHVNAYCWKQCSLIDIACKSLNLDYAEVKPHLVIGATRSEGNYITLSTEASQSIKMIHNPKVWLECIKWATSKGYQVKELGIKPSILPGVEAHKGVDILETINIMANSNLHTGVSSGLSWLAWALDKPVIMLGNFTDVQFEFSDRLVKIIDSRASLGLFNDIRYKWEANFNYDPECDNQSISTIFDEKIIAEALKSIDIINIKGLSVYHCDKGIKQILTY